MNHNNINKKYFSISQSYTTSSVRGDGDRILIKSSLKKTKTKSIKCSISEVLKKRDDADRKSMKDSISVRDDDRPVVTIISVTSSKQATTIRHERFFR
jgi:hypothetical protein